MLGKRLKLLRNEKKLYQKDIAKELNLTQESISFYESGKREPDYKTLIKFADFYGVSVDYLLGRTDTRTNVTLNTKKYNRLHNIDRLHSCNSLYSDIDCLSVESQKEIKKLVDLYKIKEMEERNKKHDSSLNGIGR
jgi:transcriptional regulator with XRE-family HTH domain